jgi:hypothetical protein
MARDRGREEWLQSGRDLGGYRTDSRDPDEILRALQDLWRMEPHPAIDAHIEDLEGRYAEVMRDREGRSEHDSRLDIALKRVEREAQPGRASETVQHRHERERNAFDRRWDESDRQLKRQREYEDEHPWGIPGEGLVRGWLRRREDERRWERKRAEDQNLESRQNRERLAAARLDESRSRASHPSQGPGTPSRDDTLGSRDRAGEGTRGEQRPRPWERPMPAPSRDEDDDEWDR